MDFFQKKHNCIILKKQLLTVIDLLDQHNIPYHLEGGTLLGIVRDGGLISWDHDADISIMSCDYDRLALLFDKIKKNGLRLKVKPFKSKHAFNPQNKVHRIIKIKDKRFYFFPGANTLDIFVKYPHKDNIYWEAQQNIMSVDKKFYTKYKEISWEKRMVKVPCYYNEYLTLKYGDWKKVNKEWNCDMELTIVKKRKQI
jgi:phosphorylcholine metabolism protein LicD